MRIFVTAIGTDSGKTLISSILCRALKADYFKPVQAGFPTDTDTLQKSVPGLRTFPPAVMLQMPASPHAAAAAENREIGLSDFSSPETENDLIVEGAGGLLVPLNDRETVADLIPILSDKLVLISNNYLGSINHTLLTINEIKRRKLPLSGLVFNGPANPETERIILQKAGCPCIFRLRPLPAVSADSVREISEKFGPEISDWRGRL